MFDEENTGADLSKFNILIFKLVTMADKIRGSKYFKD